MTNEPHWRRAVLYLIFNEGYASSGGRGLTRPDLSEEAIRPARLVDTAVPTPETRALVALTLFHHARSAARETADGTLVPLAEQDRTRWDGAAIGEANRQLAEAAAAARDEPPGPYQLQAAVASVHANAARRGTPAGTTSPGSTTASSPWPRRRCSGSTGPSPTA